MEMIVDPVFGDMVPHPTFGGWWKWNLVELHKYVLALTGELRKCHIRLTAATCQHVLVMIIL